MVGHKVLSEESQFVEEEGALNFLKAPLSLGEAIRRTSHWNRDAGCFPGSSLSDSYGWDKKQRSKTPHDARESAKFCHFLASHWWAIHARGAVHFTE